MSNKQPAAPSATTTPCAGENGDPVIDAYKKDIDRSLLRENLKLTPDERLQKLEDFVHFLHHIRGRASQKTVV